MSDPRENISDEATGEFREPNNEPGIVKNNLDFMDTDEAGREPNNDSFREPNNEPG